MLEGLTFSPEEQEKMEEDETEEFGDVRENLSSGDREKQAMEELLKITNHFENIANASTDDISVNEKNVFTKLPQNCLINNTRCPDLMRVKIGKMMLTRVHAEEE